MGLHVELVELLVLSHPLQTGELPDFQGPESLDYLLAFVDTHHIVEEAVFGAWVNLESPPAAFPPRFILELFTPFCVARVTES